MADEHACLPSSGVTLNSRPFTYAARDGGTASDSHQTGDAALGKPPHRELKAKEGMPRWALYLLDGVRREVVAKRGKRGEVDEPARVLLHPLEELRMRADHEVATLQHFCDSCRKEFTSANRLMIRDILWELGGLFVLEDESVPFGGGP